MEEKSSKDPFRNVFKSKFLRSVLLRTISIFLIFVIIIIAAAFFSFTSEINSNLILERKKQLDVIENELSRRMTEVSRIAYSVSNDESFYLEPVDDNKYSGYEMSSMLARYLTGNDFVEFLAFYRLSEPDTIYVSSGEMSFTDFLVVKMGLDRTAAENVIKEIQSVNKTQTALFDFGSKQFLSYAYPLPQFTKTPQGYVLVLIPAEEMDLILEQQLTNCFGKVAIFDETGTELYSISNCDENITLQLSGGGDEQYFSCEGKEYVLQKTTSQVNGWTYVSAIRLNDIISESANRQLIFIVLLLVIMFVAIFAMLMCIIVQYKPINNLAMKMNDEAGTGVIDESDLLSDRFAALKDDSEQKGRFETAYHEAEAANKAKSAFLSNMSHDIRTPMNAIVGMSEIAVNNSDDPECVKECLQKVRLSSQYLLDIINNVLDMSRIESGKFILSEDVVKLPKLIGDVIAMLSQSASVKSQHLVVEADNIRDENVIGDSVRLTQVFMNILSNSVKFTKNDGTISFRIRQEESDEDGWGRYVFVFSDTGIGMSPEFVGKVFETFTRDETVSVSRIEGTGLGMAIAKNFVDMMGGTIRCESELGKGTTFTVTMRMKLAPDDAENEYSDKFENLSLLVIGNDREAQLFENLGAKVKCVQDASTVKSGKYDYVVISQSDGDESGISAVTSLRGAGIESTYVLIAVDLLSVEKSAAFNEGITAFIQAPLFVSTARGILARNFEKHKSEKRGKIIDLSGKKILLAEDNPINRTIACAQLSKTNAEIVEAENGKEAVEIFKERGENYFDLILMDVQMPLMNGYEATAAIRSLPRADGSEIPIYAMTANTFDEDVRQVKEAGMNGHIGKPYEADDLYRILAQALKI